MSPEHGDVGDAATNATTEIDPSETGTSETGTSETGTERDSAAQQHEIEPDTKDWSWVVREPCPECGFDPASVTKEDLPQRIHDAADGMHQALHGKAVQTRPNPTTWSTLEYAAHVRDVCTLMRERLERMLGEENPEFEDWDQDRAAIDEDYAGQEPLRVAAALTVAANRLREAYAGVPDDAWERRGRRSNGSEFTVWTLGVYALHDLEHHVWDVERAR